MSRWENENISDLNLIDKTIFYLKKNNGITYRLYHLIYKKFIYKEKIPTGHVIRKPEYQKVKNKYENKSKDNEYLPKNFNFTNF